MRIFSRFFFWAVLGLLTGCAPWNAQTRFIGDGGQTLAPSDSAYIESERADGHNYGCSFIEFDGKGSFIDYNQLQHAVQVLKARRAGSDLMLVMYCHSWNNNAQSGDVIRFVSLLQRLADIQYMRGRKVRVEGVYLSWRGADFEPVIDDKTKNLDPVLAKDFNGSLIDDKYAADPVSGALLTAQKYFTYWAIKNRAEYHVSRIPMARAVFKLAFTVKGPAQVASAHHDTVFVLGHSFGALVLEQAIGLGSVGLLTSDWNADKEQARWPFDLIVFLNSAAPSLYAKQFRDFMADDFTSSNRPRIISLTSTADWATGVVHPIGNAFDVLSPDLQRTYRPYGDKGPGVKAWQYYSKTPGHNPYLIDHAVVPASEAVPEELKSGNADSIFARNLSPGNPPDVFYTWSDKLGVKAWKLEQLPDPKLSNGKVLTQYPSNYWIATVPPEIIKDHGDIWNTASMDMLAGMYGIASQPQNNRPQQKTPASAKQN